MTHRILDPQVLTKYHEIIKDDLEDTAPEYEPVFTSVYQYYGNSLASFTNTIASSNVTFQYRDSTSSTGCRNIHKRLKRVHTNNTGN